MISLFYELSERLFTKSDSNYNSLKTSIEEFTILPKDATDLLSHFFLKLDNVHKLEALNKITLLYLGHVPTYCAPSKEQILAQTEISAFFYELLTLANYDITITPIAGGFHGNTMLIDNIIRTQNNKMLDKILLCNVDINSGVIDNNDTIKKTQFSSALAQAKKDTNTYAFKKILQTQWSKDIDLNTHAIALMYTNLEMALCAYEEGLRFKDYKDIKLNGLYYSDSLDWLGDTLSKLFSSYAIIHSTAVSEHDKILFKEAQEKIEHIKTLIAKLSHIEGDIRSLISRETILDIITIEVKKVTKESYRRKSNQTIASIAKDVIAVFESELGTTNILTDNEETLPATLYKLSKVNYGEALMLTVDTTPEQLMSNTTSGAQAEFILEHYDINPLDCLSLIKKDSVKKQFLKRIA